MLPLGKIVDLPYPRILAIFLIFLTGCIIIPTGGDKVLSGRPVTDEELSFLKIGSTSKDEVLTHLGEPTVMWENANLFVYNWELRQGIFFWIIGSYGGAVGGAEDISARYMLLIQFDSQNNVIRFEKAQRPMSMKYGDFLREWVTCTSKPKTEEHRE